MATKKQAAAIEQIKDLSRKMEVKAAARLFCCMHTGDKNYVYSMDNLERIFDKYLERVDKLSKEYDLGDEIYLKFRKEAAEILCDAAVKRKENEWLPYFEKKFALRSDQA